jgi:superfamily II DNA or RNA helicase
VKSFQQGIWDGKKRFFKGKSFPTGLLHLVQEAIPNILLRQTQYPTPVTVNPNILKDKSMTGKYAFQAITVQDMLNLRRGIVYNATGSGKSSMAAAYIETMKVPTLFLTHQTELAKQTLESFKKSITLPVGIYGGSVDNRSFVTIGMVPTISRRLKDKQVLEWLRTIKCVVVDETHLASADTFTRVLEACTNACYRFGLSGTPLDRSEIDNIKVKAQTGPVISEVRNKDLTAINVLSKPEITLVSIPALSLDGKYAEVYDTGIVNNVVRNRKIVNITKKLLKENKSVLLLVKRVAHGEILQQMLKTQGINTAFCYGESTEEERDKGIGDIKSGKSNILIMSKIGQCGLDVPRLDSGVYCGAGKSVIEVLQSLGRYLRNPNEGENIIQFYDFYDNTEKYLKAHSEKRKAIYEREGFTVKLDS